MKPKIVYVVFRCREDNYWEILGVYSSIARAQEVMDARRADGIEDCILED